MRRVVVTGMGVVSSLGNNTQEVIWMINGNPVHQNQILIIGSSSYMYASYSICPRVHSRNKISYPV